MYYIYYKKEFKKEFFILILDPMKWLFYWIISTQFSAVYIVVLMLWDSSFKVSISFLTTRMFRNYARPHLLTFRIQFDFIFLRLQIDEFLSPFSNKISQLFIS